jgi:hypothetical protein
MPTNKNLILFVVTCVVVFGVLAQASPAFAASEKVLYSFCSANNCVDGAGPSAGVILDSAGNLYGTTQGGGTHLGCYGPPPGPCGTVFELIPTNGKWTEKVLYNFCPSDSCPSGVNVNGLTFNESGNLYGTTENSETPVDAGSVFELVHSNSKWSEKVVHDFKPYVGDGTLPYGSLIFDAAGNAYGTTYAGGTESACGSGGCGTVFELVHSNGKWTEKVLHSFNLDSGGYYPSPGLVLDKAGNLYGATISGGDLHSCSGTGCGVVFQLIHKNGAWTEKVLHTFQQNGKDGLSPQSGVIFDKAGNLYGTTGQGGSADCGGFGCGTVFELTRSNGKWTEKILHSFHNNGQDGTDPQAQLVFDKAGNIYGTTFFGGAYSNYGIVFELSLMNGKWTEKVLHSFNPNGHDGTLPTNSPLVLDKAGNLYGTTHNGGNTNCACGTVFEITP